MNSALNDVADFIDTIDVTAVGSIRIALLCGIPESGDYSHSLLEP